jgi:thiol-disulfide isomerase/thioredoxin
MRIKMACNCFGRFLLFKRKKNLVLLTLPLCIIGALVGYYVWKYSNETPRISSKSNTSSIQEGNSGIDRRNAPRFELPDAQGRIVSLESLKGNVVILHFWATWCPPCLGEIPQWVELGTVYKNQPVKLVAVSLDQQWKDADRILPSKKLSSNIISLLDKENKVPDQYGSYQFPETYILDKNLRIVLKLVGAQDWQNPELKKMIERLSRES